jgi:predicted TIM-barrel fold metal-dependent hydrolase
MPEIQRIASHVWYDTAATIFLYRDTIFPVVVKLVGADRILFASDYGLLRQKRVIDHIRQADLDATSVEMILGKNAQRLLAL